ncbi:Retrovirus-related Pol polyprotein from transposon [Smittium culicis]|uniref:Retrovirus-related Pol polyprotein from transposon n=1 Tax=Smittium culicis TaxID=133412 RepID=A0A1R1YB52_9FUNG|nr:Retrovirus-related Pol polyprotein from transposon [Smittium culicis]
MIDNQLKAKEEGLSKRQIDIEKQAQILQQEHAKHNEMVERMNVMQHEGQNVTIQLEQMKLKNKALQMEKKLVEQDLEYSNSQNAFVNNETEFEKQKQLYLSEVVKQQKDLIDSISKRPQTKSMTRTGKEIPLPTFEGNPLEFQRWIANVDDYFAEYSYITHFERNYLVVSALTKKAKEWYNSTNDVEVNTWENLYYSLKKEYRNEITYMEAINIIKTVRLTRKSKYSDFINKIRPAVAVMSKGDAEFAIPLIMDCIEKEIKIFLPIIPKETIINFENRLMEQHRALNSGLIANSNLVSSLENSRSGDKSLKDQDGDWIMAVNEINNDEFLSENEKFDEIEAVLASQRRFNSNSQYNGFRKQTFSRYQPDNNKYINQRRQYSNYNRNNMKLEFGNTASKAPISPKPPDICKTTEMCTQHAYEKTTDEIEFITPVNTLNTHLRENINFGIIAYINGTEVETLLDSGSSITTISKKCYLKLGLEKFKFKKINLRMGNNTKGSTTEWVAIATLSTGKAKFRTTFRIIDDQPYDIILGANFMILAGVFYNTSKMTITFKNNNDMDTFRMCSSEKGITEWAPLVLAASAIESSKSNDPEIQQILMSVARLFDSTPSIIKTNFPHKLRLKTDQPVKAKMRRYSPLEIRILIDHVKELYKSGYARPSKSPYSANPLIVPKADGTPRVVINFRPLNKNTIRDEYPLPRIDIILNQLFGCKIYSKIDILKAFYQIPLHEESIEASAFSTPAGHHEFLVMPQGMSNSPATFQRAMDNTLRTAIEGGYCAAFADDILIFSKNKDDHLVHLKNVLELLEQKGFKLNKEECIFGVPKVQILGYNISENGQEISPDKIDAVKNYPRPTNETTLRRFIGMVSFCRSFIDNFTDNAAPLYELLKKGNGFIWTSAQEKSFKRLKNSMVNAPVLIHPDTSKPYIMYTDASKIEIAAALFQKQSDGSVRSVAYSSRKLIAAELNYSTTDKEALGVLYGFTKYHHFVHGSVTELHTDHQTLVSALSNEDPRGRTARWNSLLQAYDYTVIHVKGLDNTVADALSRDFPENNSDIISANQNIIKSRNILGDTQEITLNVEKTQKNFKRIEEITIENLEISEKSDEIFQKKITENVKIENTQKHDINEKQIEKNIQKFKNEKKIGGVIAANVDDQSEEDTQPEISQDLENMGRSSRG